MTETHRAREIATLSRFLLYKNSIPRDASSGDETSTFTKDARAAATTARGSMLVDGEQLSALMIEHGVGVTHKALRVPKVDSDYFEEG